MITDAILGFVAWLVTTILGWFPVIPVPDWFVSIGEMWGELMAGASSMGAWVPVGLGVGMVLAVVTCMGVGLLIKGIRIAVSFFTAGGGSAG